MDRPGVILGSIESKWLNPLIEEYASYVYEEDVHEMPLFAKLPEPNEYQDTILSSNEAQFVMGALSGVATANQATAAALIEEASKNIQDGMAKGEINALGLRLRHAADVTEEFNGDIGRFQALMKRHLEASQELANIRAKKFQ